MFTRVELQEREREQLEVLAQRIERDLAAISVSDPNASATITTGQSLVTQLRNSVATGRWVIRLDELVAGARTADIVLKDGDQLIVPDQRQEVTVLGEVQYATSHVFERGLSRDDYINRSGGLSQRADKKRIYVVRANGEVVADSGAGWFQRDGGVGHPAGRLDRGAARRRSAAREVERDHADHLPVRDRCGGRELVLIVPAAVLSHDSSLSMCLPR